MSLEEPEVLKQGRGQGLCGCERLARKGERVLLQSTESGSKEADTGLPSGRLRSNTALVQGHLGGHNPGASCRTPAEGQRLLLLVCEGQRGGYTCSPAPSPRGHYLRPEPLAARTPERDCAPSVQRAAGQRGVPFPPTGSCTGMAPKTLGEAPSFSPAFRFQNFPRGGSWPWGYL